MLIKPLRWSQMNSKVIEKQSTPAYSLLDSAGEIVLVAAILALAVVIGLAGWAQTVTLR